jgi:hypothetical protein
VSTPPLHALEIHRAARPLGVRIPRPPPFIKRSDEEIALSREVVVVAVGAQAFALTSPFLEVIGAPTPPRQDQRGAAERQSGGQRP